LELVRKQCNDLIGTLEKTHAKKGEMKMKTKIFGFMALALVALAGTGIAYGHWTSVAYVNATISSGTLIVQLSNEGISTNQVDKQVANVSSSLIVPLVAHVASNTLLITITNAYPMLCVNGTFNFYNAGTIPAGLNCLDLELNDNDGNDEFFVPTGPNCGYMTDESGVPMANFSWYTTPGGPLGLNGENATLSQIDPGQTLYVHWKICFQEGLEQGETWHFYSTWTFVNWNEVGTPDVGT